ncbi:Sec translocon accessory complex subunit YajC [Caprobacter fermentans]|uniref:Preprotein translocase subunit YajC n=1 Tax=Caproicibacter fermentans TaxID=2576756 RepID=A0A6N8I4S3_9FIRM|nr:preprotein translocase subunit YajC [Caproicibacter fermentans]MVB12959.1 Sec translocon accessory complex subunit YajC [Caproicibacter fermentans]OCN02501.1 preprotein translocase subunit YajC [Clostridium sp. W14A]QNK41230.1 preprotein translocase subunit YajC [Caproicibacter fermentans]
MNFLLTGGTAGAGDSLWITILYMAVIVGIFYFLLMRPQQKKKKQEEKMRSSVQIGDDITTIGGIVGRVVGMKDDANTLIIETGTDRAKMKIKKWAVGSVDTVHDTAE